MKNPRHYDNIQEYLLVVGFAVNGDFFVKGDIKFPVKEIIGHTPATFHEKACTRGWVSCEQWQEKPEEQK